MARISHLPGPACDQSFTYSKNCTLYLEFDAWILEFSPDHDISSSDHCLFTFPPMTPREIIAEAWVITRREGGLRRWGFVASFFETFLDIKLLGYQLYFLLAYLQHRQVGFFDDIEWLYANVSFGIFLTIIISFLLLLAIEFIFPHLAAGAIIGLGAKSYRKEPVKGGLVLAIYNFLPIFGAHEFFFLASWSTTLTLGSLTLRYVTGDMKFFMIGIIVIFWILSNILKLMASFTEQGIVINRLGIFDAMGKSFKLLVSHLSHIMFILLLLFIISIRVFINAVAVLLIPAIVIGIGFLLLHFLSPLIAYVIAGIIGIILIVIVSYFFGYLHTFKHTVWTLMYLELSKQKDLDIIGEGI
ncbi:MAG: hypothetical protein JWM56_1215 [Candidatus Peribacteria bacterium]|nr:hypothetical protein [Candidatus Peribacteria bacterium]